MIQLYNVSKTFDGVDALRDITLCVKKGELVLLTGPSGAGKTTLLRTIFAAERPDAGQIVIAGRNICRLRRSSIPYLRRNVGVVFQDFKLLAERSALQNVCIALEIRGISRREVRRRGQEALDAVGLADIAHKRVSVLSGGEQQRVAIARAVVGKPAILLADEPTGNLDPERSLDILRLLHEIARNGTTVLVATHDPLLVQQVTSARVLVLENGALRGVQLVDAPALIDPQPTAPRDVPEGAVSPQPLGPLVSPPIEPSAVGSVG
jgi:cell division transport system ATP-binding protein